MIEVKTVSSPGQKLNDSRPIPVFQLLNCEARSRILLKNKRSIVRKQIPDGIKKFGFQKCVNVFYDIEYAMDDMKVTDTTC
ncbi:hypothetical protein TNCV_757721 [Trichonephila clavipes]|nr:hypothetical protein TNCV_757721 [Trichonephila clavipes]